MLQSLRLSSLPHWLYPRPYTFLGLIVVIVLAVPVLRHDQDWVTVYIPAAERLASGQDIFQAGSGFVYPPINAWLPLPFAGLPRVPGLLLWYGLNIGALAVLLLGAWKLSGGGRLEGAAPAPWREHAIFLLGLACGISSCFDAITNEQTDLIVAALVILGCLALVQARDWRAGIWLGVAAGIKCTPLLWAPYLAWQRRWSAAVLVVAVAGGINLIPDLAYPPPTGQTRLGDWAQRFLQPMAARDHEIGAWACGVGGNQSLAGIWQRWLIYDTAWEGNDLLGAPAPSRVRRLPSKPMLGRGNILLLLTAGWMCARKKSTAGADSSASPSTAALHFGMVLILMVLFSPHSSKPHFCTLLLPGFCVARAAMSWPTRSLLIGMAGAALLALSSNQDLVGAWIYSWAKWHGALAWCAVLLYAVSCRVLWQRGHNSEETAPILAAKRAA